MLINWIAKTILKIYRKVMLPTVIEKREGSSFKRTEQIMMFTEGNSKVKVWEDRRAVVEI